MRGLLVCSVGYLISCVGCASFQRRLIYFPPVFTPAQAEQYGKAERLERWESPTAGKYIGWKRLSPRQPSRGSVLIMHGNAGCAVQCGHYADAIQSAAALDVYIVEYPGYGDMPGKPTQAALERSSEEALERLPTNGPIYLVGESLGTGVAAYLAGKHPERVAGVALLAPYNSLVDVGQAHMPLLPVWLFLKDRFPAEKYLRAYRGPVAMAVATGDRVVPAKFGRRLYESYNGPKRLWEFPGGGHETVMTQPPEFWVEILAFWSGSGLLGNRTQQ